MKSKEKKLENREIERMEATEVILVTPEELVFEAVAELAVLEMLGAMNDAADKPFEPSFGSTPAARPMEAGEA